MQLDKLVSCEFKRVVAVETEAEEMTLFFRDRAGNCSCSTRPFVPFLFLDKPELLSGLSSEPEIIRLSGDAPLGFRAEFSTAASYLEAVKSLKEQKAASGISYRLISNLPQQAMMAQRLRLFRDMHFNELRRMQFDIETLTSEGFEFPNASRREDKIIIISMSDNTGWEKIISLDDMDERELLEEFVRIVAERDPDVLEGHNIFRFDLPYLETRARLHRVKLNLGRGNRLFSKRNSRFNAAERTINYTRYDLYGRHFADTYHLCIFYDIVHRNLENYGLKYVARHFGVAPANRTYVEGAAISSEWFHHRERLLEYALDDVRETRAVSAILSPSYFYQTQLVPMKYQDCIVRGNATRIDALLVSEYLNAGQSLPYSEPAKSYAGGLTRAFTTGVYKNVWHCDIRSLYPSILVAENCCPARDVLQAFPRLLKGLRLFRLEAKAAEKKASGQAEKDLYNALQTTFKILVNSFYGYLGFAQGTFNDYALAEKTAARGREILTLMLDFLKESGAKVLEMDTDGIYFVPPATVKSPEAMEAKLQHILPPGIEVELDSTYPAMFCYKSKNYALLESSGEVAITGAALKSRGLEPFQRECMEQLLTMLLKEEYDRIEGMFAAFRHAIESRDIPLGKLAKTETLIDSPQNYQTKLASGQGRRSAAYELALASSRDYQRGDQITYYITGNSKKASVVDNSRLYADAPEQRDENTLYYLNKLNDLYDKFKEFIPETRQPDLF
ncbi:MAG: DNA polymerase domain-containing protein [Victivallaceae bacterium]|nr:DNA polymerase domain-containing protein [Victivallaceae bacterium]